MKAFIVVSIVLAVTLAVNGCTLPGGDCEDVTNCCQPPLVPWLRDCVALADATNKKVCVGFLPLPESGCKKLGDSCSDASECCALVGGVYRSDCLFPESPIIGTCSALPVKIV